MRKLIATSAAVLVLASTLGNLYIQLAYRPWSMSFLCEDKSQWEGVFSVWLFLPGPLGLLVLGILFLDLQRRQLKAKAAAGWQALALERQLIEEFEKFHAMGKDDVLAARMDELDGAVNRLQSTIDNLTQLRLRGRTLQQYIPDVDDSE